MGDKWELRGRPAEEIAKSIVIAGAYLGQDRRNHFVWVDHGQINQITIRGRTEIVCGGDECTVGTSLLVYLPYDDDYACGSYFEQSG